MLFNSDFFKNAAFARVKIPAEPVAGTARLAGTFRFPEVDDVQLALQTAYMGQQLLDPPSVEGWHSGAEWVNTADLVNRINFAAQQFADVDAPGVRSIVDRIGSLGPSISADLLVDACLDLIGPINVSDTTRRELVDHAAASGEVRFDGEDKVQAEQVRSLLELIVATREYQFA